MAVIVRQPPDGSPSSGSDVLNGVLDAARSIGAAEAQRALVVRFLSFRTRSLVRSQA